MSSPFVFLDPYERKDNYRYFGREKETAQLYNAVFAANLTLLYGGSGVGKSSLVNCGLANKFYDTDWLPIYVRRSQNINEALVHCLNEAMKQQQPDWVAQPDATPAALVERLYNAVYKPIFLIFDQLEELYILGDAQQEQPLFHQHIKDILACSVQVKVVLSVREEWLANLNKFEKVVPALYENRLRVEKMNDLNLMRVIVGSIKKADISIDLTEPTRTVPLILENLRDERDGIDLTNLQVYLDRLYRKDTERKEKAGRDSIVFDPELVAKTGEMKNVLSDFIDEQLEQIEYELKLQGAPNPKGIPLEVLFTLVSPEGTRRPSNLSAIINNLPPNRQITEAQVLFCLEELANIKLLRLSE